MTTDTVRVLHLGIRRFLRRSLRLRLPARIVSQMGCRPFEKSASHGRRLGRADIGGEAIVDSGEPNPYGVLDHRVRLPGRPIVSIPLRMVPNGQPGTEVELMLFRQPGMDDDTFRTEMPPPSSRPPSPEGSSGEARLTPSHGVVEWRAGPLGFAGRTKTDRHAANQGCRAPG